MHLVCTLLIGTDRKKMEQIGTIQGIPKNKEHKSEQTRVT